MASFAADVPTMMAMVILASLVMSAAVAVVGWGRPHDGLTRWALVLLLNAAAHAMLALRGRIPDALSIVVANTLLSCVFAGLLLAIFQFQGRRARWALVMAPVLVVLGLVLAFLDDFHARVSAVGFVCGVQALWALWAIYERRHATVGRGAWLLMAALALDALVLLVRASLAASLPVPQVGLLQGGTLQTLTFMATFGVVLLSSLGFITMARDRADEANRVMAAVDALTGAANRRALIAALDRDVARAARTSEPISVLMVDIDHFKRVNDQFGHQAGDQVLCRVVKVLQERVRSQDLVGRYGGEEFLVVLPGTDVAGALLLAGELREAVESPASAIGVTVSIGVSGGRLEPGDGWDMLVAAADRALYRAKENGRNRVEVATALRRSHSQAPEDGGTGASVPAGG